LSDVWESLAAAILLDGGSKAFNEYFGRILTPYISYFIK
jgi:dsRNA-specific ribonuclease